MEFQSTLRRSRVMNAFVILSAAAGIIFFLIKDVFLNYEMTNPEFVVVIPAVLILWEMGGLTPRMLIFIILGG